MMFRWHQRLLLIVLKLTQDAGVSSVCRSISNGAISNRNIAEELIGDVALAIAKGIFEDN